MKTTMKNPRFILIFLATIVIAIIAFLAFSNLFQTSEKIDKPLEPTKTPVTNFGECVSAGNPVMESYPRQCRDSGVVFVEDIGNTLDKVDLIRLDSPRPNEVIKSPLVIRGEARGYWFFEASFPVVLATQDGRVISQGIATAKGEWMTEEFVPFETTLEFENEKITDDSLVLILKRDNPSGLPENEDALKIPVSIGTSGIKTPVDGTQTESIQTGTGSISYQNLIDYISSNITDIISAYSAKKATNDKWFADGFGFTSVNYVYVDFEDGHFLFRALLECNEEESVLACKTLAVFEKQKQ